MRCRTLLAMIIGTVWMLSPFLAAAERVSIYYPPSWKSREARARAIATALSQKSGIEVLPVVANSYGEILKDFSSHRPALVYVGSFVQSVLYARGLSIPLGQAENGQQFYTSIMIAPANSGDDPLSILKDAGAAVAFCAGASSGESGAKAATAGTAALQTKSHLESATAVKSGHAKAAFVKNWWWQKNQAKFPDMKGYHFPGISDYQHADYVLSANKAVSMVSIAKIKSAAVKSADVFGMAKFTEFNPESLWPSLELMSKAKIDPTNYRW